MTDPTASQPTTPAGYYDDGSGRRRWWDGTKWTDHYEPAQEVAATTTASAGSARRGMPVWGGVLLGVGGLVLGLIIGIPSGAATHSSDDSQPPAAAPISSDSTAPTVTAAPPPAPPAAEQPITFSGDGAGATATQTIAGGNYAVAWTTKGDCAYYAQINGDVMNDAFQASSATSGTNHVHGLKAGGLYLDVNTGPAPECGWTATFTPE